MTRISSRFTTFHKRIFPAIPLVAAAAIFLGELFKHGLTGNTLIAPFFMGLVSLGIGFRVWDLVEREHTVYGLTNQRATVPSERGLDCPERPMAPVLLIYR